MKAAVTEGNPTMNAGPSAAFPSFIISNRMQLCCCCTTGRGATTAACGHSLL